MPVLPPGNMGQLHWGLCFFLAFLTNASYRLQCRSVPTRRLVDMPVVPSGFKCHIGYGLPFRHEHPVWLFPVVLPQTCRSDFQRRLYTKAVSPEALLMEYPAAQRIPHVTSGHELVLYALTADL